MLLEALVLQYLVWFILVFFPFRWIQEHFKPAKTNKRIPKRELLEQIKAATARAKHLSFWKNKCLVQSLATRLMLQRRGIASQLVLGVQKGENNTMLAHAWIIANDMELVQKDGEYLELVRF